MDDLAIADRPLKRRRLHNEISDPILDAKRARHDLYLKSRFEEIFQKYGRDFSDTADEIDLETGEIVVNKGHLAAITNETDPGRNLTSRSQQDLDVRTAASNLGSREIEWFESDDEDVLANPSISSGLKTVIGSQKSRGQRKSNNVRPLYAETPKTGSGRPRSNGSSIEDHVQNHHSSPTDGNLSNVNTTKTSLQHPYRSLTWDRPALEPAWQAPPLPNLRLWDSSPLIQREVYQEPEAERSPSPAMDSLWASHRSPVRPRSGGPAKQRQFRPAKRKVTAQRRQSDPVLCTGDKNRDERYVSSRKHPKRWTREEEERLVELKTKTQMKYSQMLPYFPGRNCGHLSNHWSSVLLYKRRFHDTDKRPIPSEETQRLAASLDYTDELGDYPPGKTPAISNAVISSPAVACSRPRSPVKSTEPSTNHRTTTLKDKTPGAKKQTYLEEVTIDGKAHGGSQNELSDSYDELGMSPPPKRVGAPSSQFRPCLPASTPIGSKKRKGLDLSRRPVGRPRHTIIDNSSEDELATPIKSIKASNRPASGQLNSIRRRTLG